MQTASLEILEQAIAYRFKNRTLLIQALIHSSYANEHALGKHADNERLEFLGDAVLEMTVSDYLYHRYKNRLEGFLSRERAKMVCEPALAYCARQIGLGKHLLLGKGEAANGGRDRDSIISDALEAVIGAVYLDGGIEPAAGFIRSAILTDAEERRMFYDAKTILQERVQAGGDPAPVYEPVGEQGPDHAKEFIMRVRIGDRMMGEGVGRSKKLAEQNAAFEAIQRLEEH